MKLKCSKCGKKKLPAHFYIDKSNTRGRRYQCKLCENTNTKRLQYWKHKNTKEYRQNLYKRFLQIHGKNVFNIRKNSLLKFNYGITLDEYWGLLKKQNGVCAICKSSETVVRKEFNRKQNLTVDHCHITHTVRGLLCNRCNRVLGMLKENKQIMKNMMIYLEKY